MEWRRFFEKNKAKGTYNRISLSKIGKKHALYKIESVPDQYWLFQIGFMSLPELVLEGVMNSRVCLEYRVLLRIQQFSSSSFSPNSSIMEYFAKIEHIDNPASTLMNICCISAANLHIEYIQLRIWTFVQRSCSALPGHCLPY